MSRYRARYPEIGYYWITKFGFFITGLFTWVCLLVSGPKFRIRYLNFYIICNDGMLLYFQSNFKQILLMKSCFLP